MSSNAGDTPYLARGVRLLGTDSTILISSSKYLNEPRLRDWVAKIALKKNGADYPPAAEMYELIQILQDLRDFDRLEDLFREERKTNPALDNWFNAWFCSDYTIEDLKDCAPGTVGGIYYQAATQGSYDVQIVPNFKPQTQWQYYSLRAGQTHDYEHILTGGGFNYIGELLPYWFRLATIDQHIQNKELAGEMNVMGILKLAGNLGYQMTAHRQSRAENSLSGLSAMQIQQDCLFVLCNALCDGGERGSIARVQDSTRRLQECRRRRSLLPGFNRADLHR